MHLSQHGADEESLKSVRRYGRASLVMLFMERAYGPEKFAASLGELVDLDILTEDEVRQLEGWNSNLPESIWIWQYQIVLQLYKRKVFDADYGEIRGKVEMGRAAAALIRDQLGTPIPMPYVHLLSLMVKIHNLLMAIVLGFVSGRNMQQADEDSEKAEMFNYVVLLTVARCYFVSLFYNALLLISADLVDPFNGDINDFPVGRYEQGMESDGAALVSAGRNLPTWLVERREAWSAEQAQKKKAI